MAQTAITSPTDVVDFLTGQHEQIKSLFARTLSASGEAREKAFVDLRRLLAVHETVEEEIVHPRAKRKIANGEAVVGDRLEEEHEAKTVLQKLEKLDVDSEGFTRLLTELRGAVLDHANHEENDEFAQLGEELSSHELESMGRAAKLAEAIAPTRPHAGVESQMANLVAGPFAAMLDRARDAIIGKGQAEFRVGSHGYAQGMTSLGYFLSCEEFPPDELVCQAVRAEAEIAPEFAA